MANTGSSPWEAHIGTNQPTTSSSARYTWDSVDASQRGGDDGGSGFREGRGSDAGPILVLVASTAAKFSGRLHLLSLSASSSGGVQRLSSGTWKAKPPGHYDKILSHHPDLVKAMNVEKSDRGERQMLVNFLTFLAALRFNGEGGQAYKVLVVTCANEDLLLERLAAFNMGDIFAEEVYDIVSLSNVHHLAAKEWGQWSAEAYTGNSLKPLYEAVCRTALSADPKSAQEATTRMTEMVEAHDGELAKMIRFISRQRPPHTLDRLVKLAAKSASMERALPVSFVKLLNSWTSKGHNFSLKGQYEINEAKEAPVITLSEATKSLMNKLKLGHEEAVVKAGQKGAEEENKKKKKRTRKKKKKSSPTKETKESQKPFPAALSWKDAGASGKLWKQTLKPSSSSEATIASTSSTGSNEQGKPSAPPTQDVRKRKAEEGWLALLKGTKLEKRAKVQEVTSGRVRDVDAAPQSTVPQHAASPPEVIDLEVISSGDDDIVEVPVEQGGDLFNRMRSPCKDDSISYPCSSVRSASLPSRPLSPPTIEELILRERDKRHAPTTWGQYEASHLSHPLDRNLLEERRHRDEMDVFVNDLSAADVCGRKGVLNSMCRKCNESNVFANGIDLCNVCPTFDVVSTGRSFGQFILLASVKWGAAAAELVDRRSFRIKFSSTNKGGKKMLSVLEVHRSNLCLIFHYAPLMEKTVAREVVVGRAQVLFGDGKFKLSGRCGTTTRGLLANSRHFKGAYVIEVNPAVKPRPCEIFGHLQVMCINSTIF